MAVNISKRLGLAVTGVATMAIPLFFFYANNLPMHGQNNYANLHEHKTIEFKEKKKEPTFSIESTPTSTSTGSTSHNTYYDVMALEIEGDEQQGEAAQPKLELFDDSAIEVSDQLLQVEGKISQPSTITPEPTFNQPANPKIRVVEKSFVVESGDTLIAMLREVGVPTKQINNLVFSSSIPRKTLALKLKDEIFIRSNNGNLELMRILPKGKTFTEIKRSEDGTFTHETIKHPELTTEESLSFIVTKNLTLNAKEKGLTSTEIAILKSVFSEKLNLSKITKGTVISTVFKRSTFNERYYGDSILEAAVINSNGKEYSAFRWVDGDNVDYFDKEGVNLKNTFRRHPVDNVRITSSYNPKRLHPVLKITRPHRGTDYAGSRQPIRAIGDGSVYFSGRKGSFGNTVIIRHGKSVQTLSAHMYKIAKGIKKGTKVKKGQVIGYIGSTGVVTGPHLHFEMKVKGKYVNPVKADLATNEHVTNRAAFKKTVSNLMGKLPIS